MKENTLKSWFALGLAAIAISTQPASAQALLWEYKAPFPAGSVSAFIEEAYPPFIFRGPSGVVAAHWRFLNSKNEQIISQVVVLSPRGALIGKIDLPEALNNGVQILATSTSKITLLVDYNVMRTYALANGRYNLVAETILPENAGNLVPSSGLGPRTTVMLVAGVDGTNYYMRCYSTL